MDEPIRVCRVCKLRKPLHQFRILVAGYCLRLAHPDCLDCRHAAQHRRKQAKEDRRTAMIEKGRASNVRMVDQRFAGEILSVINQL